MFGLRMTQGRRVLLAILASVAVKFVMAEEEEPTNESVSMAATLLGSISFMMCLYYFINYPDEDIQQKSWETISSTISIFCAVLLWSALNDLVEAYIITPSFGEDDASYGALMVDMIHMILWFVLMQLSLGVFSGATAWGMPCLKKWEVDEDEDFPGENGQIDEEAKEKEKEEREIYMKCYAVLMAHITGFAAINAFGTVQAVFFASSPAMSFLTVPTAFIFLFALTRVTDHVREKVSTGDDGVKDDFENLWDEETEEAENDVMGLALSFTAMSSIRFAISGCLPNQEGKEEECKVEEYLFHHTTGQKIGLLGVGVVFALLIFIIRANWPEWAEEEAIDKIYEKKFEEAGVPSDKHIRKCKKNKKQWWTDPQQKADHKRIEKEKHSAETLGRTLEGLSVAIAMCFSWAFFYGIQMVLAGNKFFRGEDELLAVCLALVVSFIMMFGLIPLDKMADADWSGPAVDRAIRSLMDAMGLLIGFAWEQCFDTSVDALAVKSEGSKSPLLNVHSTKLLLTIFCAALLVPAWKMYILPFMVAKGWKFGYVFKLEQLEEVAKKLTKLEEGAEDEEEEGGGEEFNYEPKGPKTCPKKLAKVQEIFSKVLVEGQETAAASEEEKIKIRKATENIGAIDVASYQALPGDEAEALRQKNKQLVDELAKAKAASLKAQQMLDTTMESMMSSMKHMHETVSRIESNA